MEYHKSSVHHFTCINQNATMMKLSTKYFLLRWFTTLQSWFVPFTFQFRLRETDFIENSPNKTECCRALRTSSASSLASCCFILSSTLRNPAQNSNRVTQDNSGEIHEGRAAFHITVSRARDWTCSVRASNAVITARKWELFRCARDLLTWYSVTQAHSVDSK